MALKNMQFNVQQFDGSTSFTLWQRRVKDILVQQGLAKPLEGDSAKPANMKTDEWEELKEKCVSTIRLFIGDKIINNVIEMNSAPELWKKLEQLYLAKSLSNKLHLKRQLYRLKMAEGENLMDHMNVFNGILDQLQKVDVKIEEEDKALLLLTSVPDSYESVINTLLYGKDTLELEKVQSSLLDHEKQKKANQDDQLKEIALVARGKNRKGRRLDSESQAGSSKVKEKGDVQCYGCHKFGHVKRNCPHKKEKNEGKTVAYASDGDLLTVSTGMDISSREGWILDSGCVSHVCSKLDYFDKLQVRKAGFLSLGDGSKCRVHSIGVVKIKMMDGTVRSLGGVTYVPKMRRNLISLSQLDSEGFQFSAGGGVLKITHGETVLMEGKKYENLYHLVTSMNWEWCIGKGIPSCFHVVNGGERKIPAKGEGDLRRSFSRIN